jgi:hypothetical protein
MIQYFRIKNATFVSHAKHLELVRHQPGPIFEQEPCRLQTESPVWREEYKDMLKL